VAIKKVKALLKFRDASLKKGLMFFEKGLDFFLSMYLGWFQGVLDFNILIQVWSVS
jgi:hypothetical protein